MCQLRYNKRQSSQNFHTGDPQRTCSKTTELASGCIDVDVTGNIMSSGGASSIYPWLQEQVNTSDSRSTFNIPVPLTSGVVLQTQEISVALSINLYKVGGEIRKTRLIKNAPIKI